MNSDALRAFNGQKPKQKDIKNAQKDNKNDKH